jgi:hypothetical protein
VTRLQVERPNNRGSIPGRDNTFISSPEVNTDLVPRSHFHSMGTGYSFPGDKAAGASS